MVKVNAADGDGHHFPVRTEFYRVEADRACEFPQVRAILAHDERFRNRQLPHAGRKGLSAGAGEEMKMISQGLRHQSGATPPVTPNSPQTGSTSSHIAVQ